jgi:uncharacterized C2H2 Zn-finger protein
LQVIIKQDGPVENSASEHLSCVICLQLGDLVWASQKYGWEENDTTLPVATKELLVILDLKPNSSRALQLRQCPKCKTYYRYERDYEYLVNGSEDEQSLKRLNAEEAGKLLDQPPES